MGVFSIETIGMGRELMIEKAPRKRFAAWILRSRVGRFLVYFPLFTLSCYLVQYIVDRIWGPTPNKSEWTFPLLFGIFMGITYAFLLRNSFTDRLK